MSRVYKRLRGGVAGNLAISKLDPGGGSRPRCPKLDAVLSLNLSLSLSSASVLSTKTMEPQAVIRMKTSHRVGFC